MRGLVIFIAIVVLALSACDDTESPTPDGSRSWSEVSDQRRSRVHDYYAARCATCHGPEGAGDGPSGRGSNPPPTDFTDPQWATRLDDQTIIDRIVGGSAAIGRPSSMPTHPDLRRDPELAHDLTAYLRHMGP